MLQQQGLLDYLPRKCCIIALKSESEIKEIFYIRCLLENNRIEILIKENILADKDFDNMNEIIKEMGKLRILMMKYLKKYFSL